MDLVTKLNQFIANLNGQSIEVSDRTNIYQCYDLAANWVVALDLPLSTISHLYASQIYTNPNPNTTQYFDLLPNTQTFIPIAGDIAVFSNKVLINGVWIDVGHVGIALSGGNMNNFSMFNQNYPLGSPAKVGNFDYNNPKLLGVLRLKNLQPNPNPPIDGDSQRALDQVKEVKVRDGYGNMEGAARGMNQASQDVKIIPSLKSQVNTLTDKINKAKGDLN